MIGLGAKVYQNNLVLPVAFPLGYEPDFLKFIQHDVSNYAVSNQRYILSNMEQTQAGQTSDVEGDNISSCCPRDVTIKDLVMDIRENAVNAVMQYRIWIDQVKTEGDAPTIPALTTGQVILSLNIDIDQGARIMGSLDMGAITSQNSFDHNGAVLVGVNR